MSLWRTQIRPVLVAFSLSFVSIVGLSAIIYGSVQQTKRVAHRRQRALRVKTQGKSGLLSLPNEVRVRWKDKLTRQLIERIFVEAGKQLSSAEAASLTLVCRRTFEAGLMAMIGERIEIKVASTRKMFSLTAAARKHPRLFANVFLVTYPLRFNQSPASCTAWLTEYMFTATNRQVALLKRPGETGFTIRQLSNATIGEVVAVSLASAQRWWSNMDKHGVMHIDMTDMGDATDESQHFARSGGDELLQGVLANTLIGPTALYRMTTCPADYTGPSVKLVVGTGPDTLALSTYCCPVPAAGIASCILTEYDVFTAKIYCAVVENAVGALAYTRPAVCTLVATPAVYIKHRNIFPDALSELANDAACLRISSDRLDILSTILSLPSLQLVQLDVTNSSKLDLDFHRQLIADRGSVVTLETTDQSEAEWIDEWSKPDALANHLVSL